MTNCKSYKFNTRYYCDSSAGARTLERPLPTAHKSAA